MKRLGVLLLIAGLSLTACHKKTACPAYGDLHTKTGKDGMPKVSRPKSGLFEPSKKRKRH